VGCKLVAGEEVMDRNSKGKELFVKAEVASFIVEEEKLQVPS
jgi:hypothetical protein